MDRYGGGGGGYRDQSSDRRGGGGGYRDQSADRRGGGGGGYRDQSADRRGGPYRGGPSRGGPSRGGPGEHASFHKTPGGDFQRMPDSVAHQMKPGQHQAYGTEGRPIELVSNFYRLMSSDLTVTQYDVTITKVRVRGSARPGGDVSSTSEDPARGGGGGGPEGEEAAAGMDEKSARLRELFIKKFADSIMAKFVADHPTVFQGVHHAYDGWKNLYTNKRLNLGGQDELAAQLEMTICDRPATFLVRLQTACKISMGEAVDFYNGKSSTPVSEQVIAVFDVIFRFVIGKSYATYQRKFFDLSEIESAPRIRLVDFVQGFISSVRQTEFGLALNVNLKTSAIISRQFSALVPLICEVLGLRDQRELQSIRRQQAFQATKMIRHLKIFTTHSRRTVEYTVDALVDRYPHSETFDCKGRRITYADYFHEQYGLNLQKLPMVRVTKRNIHLPLELCQLKEHQFLNKSKMDGNVQREMLFKSTHTPNVFFHKVARIIGKIKEADSGNLLREFGLDMEPRAARIEGRVLPAPRTLCGNMRDRLHKTAATLPTWAIFCFNDVTYRRENLQQFARTMSDQASNLGLHLPDPVICECVRIENPLDIFNVFNNVHTKTNVQMIFIGIPSRSDTVSPKDMYDMVKHCCNQRFGLMNQCFSADKMLNLPGGYFQQFLLKVNGKMGGENSVIEPTVMARLPFNPSITMLVGVDVVNFASDAGERLRSKVVAAVGSYSDNFTRYNATIRVQVAGETETITDLQEMVVDLLRQYEAANRCFPKNLILFRSGLSDGQFDPVLEAESPAIRRAIADVGATIKVVYIVVQKRHHARFALAQQDTSGRKPTYNVPSGTVVDKGIVNPARRCFYLNSHFSPLGTSRSSKYTILRDDLKLSPDEVQKLCFYSCYNSCRTRSVISQPTPVRYADLLCQRSKNHLDAQRNADEEMTMATVSTGSVDLQVVQERVARLNEQVQLHENVRNALFYC